MLYQSAISYSININDCIKNKHIIIIIIIIIIINSKPLYT